MLKTIGRLIFGSANDRIIKKLQSRVIEINALEDKVMSISDEALKEQTNKLRKELEVGKTLDDILPMAFAVVREASRRALGIRHFDVQLLGGMILHKGMISEMRTGEGKTFIAPLAAYLNALSGKGVHVVTVNDYLAKRDSEWMAKIYNALGLTVGCITHETTDEERQAAYKCDITYGTNNEFGFDYLRDNMKFSLDQMVQRDFNFAIIDEIDCILVDEARTPLIISGPTEDNSDLYVQIDKLIPLLDEKDYEKDEKSKTVVLTEDGTNNMEELLIKHKLLKKGDSLYDIHNVPLVHHINQALRAHMLFTIDVDYMIKDDGVLIIDEFTGRAMEGRRYSEGLHQALEAKEHVTIQNENQTLASITFQNYFRLYPKLSGMTGTAMTEANEFYDIYKLEVVEVPTNREMIRQDEEDLIYRTAKEKYDAIVEEIEKMHLTNQPVLVGTISIEKSEYIASLLKKKKIKHNILNAKHHEQEASIIAQAGKPGAVTIATNMAGRGTDIMMGGNPEMFLANNKKLKEADVMEQTSADKKVALGAGGLCVIGTERHESRRIDNQLRGRSGRQGDPGRSLFYLSLEDDLMRIFASERTSSILKTLGLEEGEAIVHPMISRALEKAQQKVEARNYEIRKNLLKFDDVANDQRKVIYEQRKDLMKAEDISETVEDMYLQINEEIIAIYIPPKTYPEQWNVEGMRKEIFRVYGLSSDVKSWVDTEGVTEEKILDALNKEVKNLFKEKEDKYGSEVIRTAEKRFLLMTIDQLWKDHLHSLDHLRQGINLRAYGQRDPLNEYKREAFMMFEVLLASVRELFIERIAHMELTMYETEHGRVLVDDYNPEQEMHESRVDPAFVGQQEEEPENFGGPVLTIRNKVEPEDRDKKDPSTWGKVGRNEECPCGSGKKYKNCHGKLKATI